MDAIVVFAKAPVPGQVKTRLARSLGDEAAAGLYRAMLLDTLSLAKKASRSLAACEVLIAHTPANAFEDGTYSLRRLWLGATLPQCEGELGEKILDCFTQLRSQGAERVVIIGSDAPDLPPGYICRAFAGLDQNCKAITLVNRNIYHRETSLGADVALGPARDGGFYLIGASRLLPADIFANVEWSTTSTLAQVLTNAEQLRLRTTTLSPWHDIDCLTDLHALIQNLRQGYYGHKAVETRRWLQSKGFI